MHVAINTSPLHTGHTYRGSGTYVRSLLAALKQFTPEVLVKEFIEEEITTDVECIHYPFFDPFFLTAPHGLTKPFVLTIHDLIPIMYPEHFPKGLKGSVKWQIEKQRARKARAIITDSQASKNDIINVLTVPESRVHAIPLAPDPVFKKISDNNILEMLNTKYNLPDEFLLYVGDVNWNKNVPGMLKAIAQTNIPLVLVGKAFLNEDLPEVKQINTVIGNEKIHDRIIKLGFVEADDLPGIYSLARLTLCVSYAEGFGFPVLESMACGTPCVVSNCSSLKEIAGPSVLVDPWMTDSIVNGIEESLKRNRISERQKCFDWAQTYTWKNVAEQTRNVYKEII